VLKSPKAFLCMYLLLFSSSVHAGHGETLFTHQKECGFDEVKKTSERVRDLDDQEKIAIMEDYAVSVKEFTDRNNIKLNQGNRLVLYSWVPDWKAYFTNTYLVDLLIWNTKGMEDPTFRQTSGKVHGNGLYVSRNPFDSSSFSLTSTERNILISSPKSKQFEMSDEASQGSYLVVALVNGDEKILDLDDEGIRSKLLANGVSSEDTRRLNPNLLMNLSVVGREWMLLKLRSGFTVRGARPEDLPDDVAHEAVEKMKRKEIYGGQWFFRKVADYLGRLDEI
jgi:hypothetical protein